MTDFEFFDIASGEFLAESFPSEAVLWNRDSLAEFCEEFKCEDFEGFEGGQILHMIEGIRDLLVEAYKIGKIETS
jgi:hypothetical protein